MIDTPWGGKTMDTGKKFVTFLLVAVIALGCGFGGGILASGFAQRTNEQTIIQQESTASANSTQNTTPGYSQTTKDTTKTDTNKTTSTVQILDPNIGETISEKVMASVVGIDTIYETATSGGYWYFFGGGGTRESEAQGTGFIVDEAGYILTNSHVINDGDYKTVTVHLYDGRVIEGEVLWNDSTLDLAIVKIEADNLVAAELGDSDELKVGSYAAALGNPLGLQFKFSMSQGIISGLDRTIEVSNGSSSYTTTMEGLLQTDATINSGNSGGPLVNSNGQVIGINSAKATEGESMGFAIPINAAKPIIAQIKETGSFRRAYLGITGIGLEESGSNYDAAAFKERYGTDKGIYVNSVASGGGAERAGLKKGDIIISIEGTEVGTMNKINTVLVAYKDGDSVEVTYLRDGKTETVMVVLSSNLS